MSMVGTQNRSQFSKLEARVAFLEEQMKTLRRDGTRSFEITTFAPEPYRVLHPIPVAIQESEDEFLASFVEANINSSGSTSQEAFANVRELILDIFDTLDTLEPARLGPKPRRQLGILKEYLCASENHQRARPEDH